MNQFVYSVLTNMEMILTETAQIGTAAVSTAADSSKPTSFRFFSLTILVIVLVVLVLMMLLLLVSQRQLLKAISEIGKNINKLAKALEELSVDEKDGAITENKNGSAQRMQDIYVPPPAFLKSDKQNTDLPLDTIMESGNQGSDMYQRIWEEESDKKDSQVGETESLRGLAVKDSIHYGKVGPVEFDLTDVKTARYHLNSDQTVIPNPRFFTDYYPADSFKRYDFALVFDILDEDRQRICLEKQIWLLKVDEPATVEYVKEGIRLKNKGILIVRKR